MENNNNPEEKVEEAVQEKDVVAAAKKPDQYIVQTRTVIESWDHPKKIVPKEYGPGEPKPAEGSPKEYMAVADTSKAPVKTTKLVNGEYGPFRKIEIAEQLVLGMASMPEVISAVVMTIEDDPSQRQVPASEDVLRQMVAKGQVPGVPADAKVTVEADQPDNLVAFPGSTPTEPGPAVEE